MAYLINKTVTTIHRWNEVQIEVPAHLEVSLDDIIDLKARIDDYLKDRPSNIEENILSLIWKTGFNMGSKNAAIINFQWDNSSYDLLRDIRESARNIEYLQGAPHDSALLIVAMKDLESYLKTYRNIGRKLSQQIDTMMEQYLLRYGKMNESIAIKVWKTGLIYENALLENQKIKTSCIDHFIYKLQNNQSIINYGEWSKVRKWELEEAIEANGLSLDKTMNDLEFNGFINKYFTEKFSFEYDTGENYFTLGLDMNFNNTFSFIGNYQNTTFENDLKNFFNTNNYFEAIILFYQNFFSDYISLYNTCSKKIAYIKDNFYASMENINYNELLLTGNFINKEVVNTEIYAVNNQWQSIIDFLAYSNAFCKLNTLKYILDYEIWNKEYVYEYKLLKTFTV